MDLNILSVNFLSVVFSGVHSDVHCEHYQYKYYVW